MLPDAPPGPADEDAAFAAENARSACRYGGLAADRVTWAAHGSRILVTAPHAVAHWREGRRKPADLGTGFLAALVGARTGADTLVADGEQTRDGNYHADGVFKTMLGAALRDTALVVDLHGMGNQYGPDVCLGLGAMPHLAEPLVAVFAAALRGAGYHTSVNDPFRADRPHTVTSTAQRAGVAAIQLEIAARHRRPFAELDAVRRLAAAIAAAVEEVAA